MTLFGGIVINKKLRNISIAEYTEIIQTMIDGCAFFRPNLRVAAIFALIVTTGCGLSDILKVESCALKQDGNTIVVSINDKVYQPKAYELDILLRYVSKYRISNTVIGEYDRLFSVGSRGVEKCLQKVCDYLGLEDVGIQSFKRLHGFFTEYESATHIPDGYNSAPKNMRISGVYSIRCKKNGRLYIGESDNVAYRWDQHIEKLKKRIHHSKLLQSDYDRYGLDGFEFKLLGLCTSPSERRSMESNFINALGTIQFGYNTLA